MTFFAANNCKKNLSGPVLLGVTLAFTSVAGAGAPFGSEADLEYAATLWSALESKDLAGANPIYSRPYAGTEPHGFVLETLEAKVTVGQYNNWAVVKRNYGPAGISTETVSNEREKHLKAVTVMFKRESGYDPDNQDWFWVKYAPDGSVLKNPKGMALAGRVAKGATKGCIACHQAAPGGDYLFVTDRLKPE